MAQIVIGLLIVAVSIFLIGKYSNKTPKSTLTQTGGGTYTPSSDESVTSSPKDSIKVVK